MSSARTSVGRAFGLPSSWSMRPSITSRGTRAGSRAPCNGVLRAGRGARLAAVTSGGAIPDNNNYTVVQWPEETRVGSVDEDFAIDSSAGDVFQLGNTSWRIRRIEAGRVLVEDARGQPPTIPHRKSTRL